MCKEILQQQKEIHFRSNYCPDCRCAISPLTNRKIYLNEMDSETLSPLKVEISSLKKSVKEKDNRIKCLELQVTRCEHEIKSLKVELAVKRTEFKKEQESSKSLQIKFKKLEAENRYLIYIESQFISKTNLTFNIFPAFAALL